MNMDQVTLAILAGGAGQRMGRPKGLLTIAGNPILRFLHDRLRWTGPTLLVTAPGREHPPGHEAFDAEAVDAVADEGPLRGVLTALQHAATPLVVIHPVDMPGIDPSCLRRLVSELDARPACHVLMTRHRNRLEPFPSAYRRTAAEWIEARLAGGNRALHGLADDNRAAIIPAPPDWPETIWTNLNDPADLARFAARFA